MTIRASKSQSKLRRYQEGIIAIVALSGTLVSAHVQPSTSTSIAAHRHVGAFVTTRHNIILFIPDGLRPSSITPQDTPALASLAQDGVGFLNSHALYPTINTTNAAAFLSGQLPGDTGAYADRFFDEPPVNAASNSALPGLEYGNIHSAILAAFAGSDLYPTSILDDANGRGMRPRSSVRAHSFICRRRTGRRRLLLMTQPAQRTACRLTRRRKDYCTTPALQSSLPKPMKPRRPLRRR
jgi:hypothetical protein